MPGAAGTANPMSVGIVTENHPAHIVQYGDGSCTVTHREYVNDINGTAAWGMQKATFVNPSNVLMTPWLAAIATDYEFYIVDHYDAYYEPQCGQLTTGTAQLCFDYDAIDLAPYSKKTMMDMNHAVRASVFSSVACRMHLPSTERVNMYIIRTPNDPTPAPDINRDVAAFFLSTAGVAPPTPVGELYIDYTVHLINPQPHSRDVCYQAHQLNNAVITAPLPLGSDPTSGDPNPFVIDIDDPSVTILSSLALGLTQITFAEPGTYLITMSCHTTAGTYGALTWQWVPGAGVVFKADPMGQTTTQGINPVTATTGCISGVVTVASPPTAASSINLAYSVGTFNTASGKQSTIRVVSVSNSLLTALPPTRFPNYEGGVLIPAGTVFSDYSIPPLAPPRLQLVLSDDGEHSDDCSECKRPHSPPSVPLSPTTPSLPSSSGDHNSLSDSYVYTVGQALKLLPHLTNKLVSK
jgi:hypothetical protein